MLQLKLRVNGCDYGVSTWPMERLLDVLRRDLHLTGTKEGCGEGECGSCAVLVNGKLTNSCLVPAVQAMHAEIVTIEGLEHSRLQQAFIDTGGAQCGFCTPGMIMASHALLGTNPKPTEFEIREALSGNLCRCTGYNKIIDAVLRAAE